MKAFKTCRKQQYNTEKKFTIQATIIETLFRNFVLNVNFTLIVRITS